MEIVFSPQAINHINFWKKTNNRIIQKRISNLIKSILANPYKGIGKPEPLKYELSGKWSRKIDKEHRIIYKIEDSQLIVFSLKGHY